ncbi:MAG: type I-MYXAN CRISPR-associated protein Cas6/Cmx6 [Pseudomonadota bacterium]
MNRFMYWNDQEERQKHYLVPDDIVDISFKVQCKQLPLDHAYELSQVIQAVLPWFAKEPQTGIHLIHGAESGNGWIRPEEPDALLSLSRRTRFMLRVPKNRIDDTSNLAGKALNVAGNDLLLSAPHMKPLSALTTIFARYVATDNMDDEEAFLNHAAQLLEEQGITVKKMMCGRAHILRMPGDDLLTRSLMIDGLEVEESVHLQQHGLGEGRLYGCGLFMPHKGIDAVGEAQES